MCIRDSFNVAVPHIGKGGLAVSTERLLQLIDNMFNSFQIIFADRKLPDHRFVALDELSSGKPLWNSERLRMILHHVTNGMNGAVNRAMTKIQMSRKGLVLCGFQRDGAKLVNAFVSACLLYTSLPLTQSVQILFVVAGN